jgi:hypothetical protein
LTLNQELRSFAPVGQIALNDRTTQPPPAVTAEADAAAQRTAAGPA